MTTRFACLLSALLVLALSGVADAQATEISPVKIGVLNDQQTTYAAGGGRGSFEAARMAAEDAGPVLGKPVEIVSADHQNKADVGSAIARSWFDQDGVDMIADVPNSAVGFAVQDIATLAVHRGLGH
jgi:branched-chain amino acid transport system substrate-binding protein